MALLQTPSPPPPSSDPECLARHLYNHPSKHYFPYSRKPSPRIEVRRILERVRARLGKRGDCGRRWRSTLRRRRVVWLRMACIVIGRTLLTPSRRPGVGVGGAQSLLSMAVQVLLTLRSQVVVDIDATTRPSVVPVAGRASVPSSSRWQHVVDLVVWQRVDVPCSSSMAKRRRRRRIHRLAVVGCCRRRVGCR